MAGGPPVLNIGAEGYLGGGSQTAFGTPLTPIPASAKNWIEFTANDLNFDAAHAPIETGAGTRATEGKAGRGMSKTQGGVTHLLQPTAGAFFLAKFLGLDTYATATHTMTPTRPGLLTLQKIMAAQALQYQDVLLDTLVLGQAGAQWTAKYTVLGGIGDTPIASDTPTMPTDALVFQWGDTTLTSAFGSLSQGELSALQVSMANNVRQFPGAGSYAPTKATGGKFAITGTCTYLYDSAAAAAAQAAYIAGTESTLTMVLTKDSTHKLTLNMPLCHMTASTPNQGLDDLVTMNVSWFVRQPAGISIALLNDDTAAYV